MCVVDVKYCNHLLAVDMAGVDCGVRVVGKMSKDTGMGVHKGTVVSFVPTLFGCFLGIPSLHVFFFFFRDLFQLFLARDSSRCYVCQLDRKEKINQ